MPGHALGSRSVEGVPDQVGLTCQDHLPRKLFSIEGVVGVVDRGVVVLAVPVVDVQAEVAAGTDASDAIDRVRVAGFAGGIPTSAAARSSGSAFAGRGGRAPSSSTASAGSTHTSHAALAGGAGRRAAFTTGSAATIAGGSAGRAGTSRSFVAGRIPAGSRRTVPGALRARALRAGRAVSSAGSAITASAAGRGLDAVALVVEPAFAGGIEDAAGALQSSQPTHERNGQPLMTSEEVHIPFLAPNGCAVNEEIPCTCLLRKQNCLTNYFSKAKNTPKFNHFFLNLSIAN